MARWAVNALALVVALAAGGAAAQEPPAAAPKAPAAASLPAPAPAPAPAPPTADQAAAAAAKLTPDELQALKAQMRSDVDKDVDAKIAALKEEMQNEVRAAQTSAAATQDWEAEWQDVKPKLQFFQANGYYRLRMTLWQNGDLGLPPGSTPSPWFSDAHNPAGNHTMAQADMRFRIQPTLNVSEDVRLKGQFNVLDHLVLGSQGYGSLGFGFAENAPLPGGYLTNTQLTTGNAIDVQRVWAEVVTPVGELRFGRMGVNWGLGMWRNDGNCFTCDYGDTEDRILFASRIANHVFALSLDFVSEGPLNPSPYSPLGQNIDATQLDDSRDLVLTILRRDTDEEIQKLRVSGQSTFVNYGLWVSYNTQGWSAVSSGAPTNNPANPTLGLVKRDAWSVTPDLWFRLLYKKYRLEIEALTIQGHIGNHATAVVTDANDPANQALSISQFGGVLQNELKLADDKLSVRLELGFASGDSAPGFGVLPDTTNVSTATPSYGGFQGPQFVCNSIPCSDSSINNFRFNRDYRIDLILWNSILTTVTDAFYIRPGVQYSLTEGLNLDAQVVFSQALNANSTATGKSAALGIEIDGGVTYQSDDGFVAGLAYGVLFPLAGLNGLTTPTDRASVIKDASTAQEVRGIFGIVY